MATYPPDALSIPSLLTTQPGLLDPPAAPGLVIPKLLAMPAPGFRERLAAGLASAPGYTPQAYESGGSRFGRGLLAGASQGFSRSGLLTMKGSEERVAEKNAVERASADRANTIANETWRAKLSDYYKTKADRTGKLEITKQMAAETGLPEGSFAEPVQIATLRNSRAQQEQTNARVPVMESDWSYLMARGGIPKPIQDERAANNGTLSPQAYKAFQAAVDNLRATDNSTRMAKATAASAGAADIGTTVGTILNGIAAGTLSPEIEKYASRDGRLRNALAVGAVDRGLDLATLRQQWAANNKGINTANSPQQLRMRQAAQNIPSLLEQLAGPVDPATGERAGGVIAQLNSSGIPIVNQVRQWGQKATGKAGPLKQYNILANKLAMEQAFLMSGGNAPPADLYAHLLDQYKPSDNPDNVRNALETVAETVRGYQESISQVGPIGPAAPYTPDASRQNPIGGATWNLGTKPAAGTTAEPDEFARYRRKPPGRK